MLENGNVQSYMYDKDISLSILSWKSDTSLVEQELLTLPEHLSSPTFFWFFGFFLVAFVLLNL